jgi:hypothetical protein
MKTTPAENQVVMEGTIAYYGTYTVDETGKTVSLRVEASSFPNQVGSEQKRTITSLTASELKLSNPTALTGGQIKGYDRTATFNASREDRINHSSPGVTAGYSHGCPLELKRAFLTEWTDHVERLIRPKGTRMLR